MSEANTSESEDYYTGLEVGLARTAKYRKLSPL